MLSRRQWIASALGGAALGMMGRSVVAQETVPRITVYRSPTCGCCGNWVEHLRADGFPVHVEEVSDVGAVKAEHGVPSDLASCHTGLVEGYVVEGHVPAQDIRHLLEQRPEALGIAVPGMPIGSPGMEMGSRRDPFEVIAFDRAGKRWTFARHG